jgi:uncharacterized protein (TIGR02246 family)
MINGINHIAIATHDLDRLIAFYRDVLGFEVSSVTEWSGTPLIDSVVGVPGSAARAAMLKAGNVYLEFFQYLSPETPATGPLRQPYDRGYTHLCLDVTDIDTEYARLSAAGAVFHRAPPHFPDAGLRSVYGRDPDGNLIEIQETLTRQFGASLEDLPLIGSLPTKHAARSFSGPAEDRLMIRELIDAYADAVNQRDAVAWGALWAEDASWSMPEHPGFETCHGRTAIVETWTQAMTMFAGVVFVASVGAIVVTGDRATARSYTSEVYDDPDGVTHRDRGIYDDTLVRREGAWMFQTRRFRNIHRS